MLYSHADEAKGQVKGGAYKVRGCEKSEFMSIMLEAKQVMLCLFGQRLRYHSAQNHLHACMHTHNTYMHAPTSTPSHAHIHRVSTREDDEVSPKDHRGTYDLTDENELRCCHEGSLGHAIDALCRFRRE